MLGKLGLPELLILLAIVFFLFGAKRLPEIGKGIGAVSYTHLTLPTNREV